MIMKLCLNIPTRHWRWRRDVQLAFSYFNNGLLQLPFLSVWNEGVGGKGEGCQPCSAQPRAELQVLPPT
jgi:hypothetical protein